MWRPQPRNASAFLVDQDRRIAATDRVTQFRCQRSHLRWIIDIAAKQDKAERIGAAEEFPLFIA